jgi:hypothetical protein
VEVPVLAATQYHLEQVLTAVPIQELAVHLIKEIVSVTNILQAEYS